MSKRESKSTSVRRARIQRVSSPMWCAIEQAVTTIVEWMQARPLCWFSDGCHGYAAILRRAYRHPALTGKRGLPPLVVPATVTLT